MDPHNLESPFEDAVQCFLSRLFGNLLVRLDYMVQHMAAMGQSTGEKAELAYDIAHLGGDIGRRSISLRHQPASLSLSSESDKLSVVSSSFSPPVSPLPLEILGEIFIWTLSLTARKEDIDTDLINLCLVSKTWRLKAALAAPQLWNTLSIKLDTQQRTPPSTRARVHFIGEPLKFPASVPFNRPSDSHPVGLWLQLLSVVWGDRLTCGRWLSP